jgi:dienelactone hydrolase
MRSVRLVALLAIAAGVAGCGKDGATCLPPQDVSAELPGRDPAALYRDTHAVPVAPATAAAWASRAAELRAGLRAAMRIPYPRTVPAAQVVGTRTVDGVVIEDLLIDGFGGQHIPATLYRPASATGPVPGMVLNVGHVGPTGQHASYIRELGWRFAKNGVAAIGSDWWGMGSRFASDARHVPLGVRSYLAGLMPQEPTLDEPLRVFDYLAARPELDPDRIGVAGQSGGGWASMYMAAIDERVAAAVIVDIVATTDFILDQGWGDPDAMVPTSFATSSHGEILGLIAPRPALVLSGDDDLGVGPTEIAAAAVELTRDIYAVAGGVFDHAGYPGAHEYSAAKVTHTLAFIGEQFLDAPIASTLAPPNGTAPNVVAPASDPRWPELLEPRWAIAPAPPGSGGEAESFITTTSDRLRQLTGFARLPVVPAGLRSPNTGAPDVAIVWVMDAAPAPDTASALQELAPWVVTADPGGLCASGLDEFERLHLAQDGIAMNKPVLGVGLEDLVAAADAVRADGAAAIAVVCDGPQAALVCAAAAAVPGAVDGFVLRGLPRDFRTTFAFGQPDPILYYVTPDLGATVDTSMLVALAAPRPVAVVGTDTSAWTHPAAVYGALGAPGALYLGEPDLVAAAARVVDALAPR